MKHAIDSPDFIARARPGRLASLESDLAVPVGQAAAVAIAVGLAAGVVVLLLGPVIADLGGAALWAWSGRIAAVFAVGTLASAVVLFVAQTRRALLGQVERWADRDLDGDGVIGEPATVRVELHGPNKGQQRFIDLPVELDVLRRVAVAVLHNGKAFSRPQLAGVLSQGQYNRLAAVMERRGLVARLPGNRRELTAAGRAVLRRVLG